MKEISYSQNQRIYRGHIIGKKITKYHYNIRSQRKAIWRQGHSLQHPFAAAHRRYQPTIGINPQHQYLPEGYKVEKKMGILVVIRLQPLIVCRCVFIHYKHNKAATQKVSIWFRIVTKHLKHFAHIHKSEYKENAQTSHPDYETFDTHN
ncbi:MAG: hypothetical protein IKL54_00665 [Bacteroidaceae bacterium]|nr:hypothetical protein [Bacteroidaceae bacterium]